MGACTFCNNVHIVFSDVCCHALNCHTCTHVCTNMYMSNNYMQGTVACSYGVHIHMALSLPLRSLPTRLRST